MMSCYFHASNALESTIATRTPFKIIQVASRDEDMSTTRKYGLTQYNNVPRQNRFSKSTDLCASKLATRRAEPLSNVNISSAFPKSKTCDKVSASSKVSRKESPSPEGGRKKASEGKSAHVQSLTSSPKWSRIKDKFESTEFAEKEPVSQNGTTKCLINSRPSTLGISVCQEGSVRKTAGTKPSVNLPKPVPETKLNIKNKTLLRQDEVTVNKSGNKRLQNAGESTASKSSVVGARSKILSSERSNSFLTGTASDITLQNGSGSDLKFVHTKGNCVPVKPSVKNANDCSSLLQPKPNNQDSSHEPLKKSFQRLESKSSDTCNGKKRNDFSTSLCTAQAISSSKVAESGNNLLSNYSTKPQIRSKCENDTFLHRYAKNKPLNSSNAQSSAKSIWVKDEAGNWTRKPTDGQALQTSKVAVLRKKFNSESSNTSSHNVLSKSRTASSVPLTVGTGISGKLLKSNTVSDVFSSSRAQECLKDGSTLTKNKVPQSAITSASSSNSSSSSISECSEKASASSDEKYANQAHKLSIVQKAVLSYEENISLLSPETQKKLKLLGEKVKAQNEEDSLMEASKKCINVRGVNDNIKKSINTEKNDCTVNNDTKQSFDSKTLGEPVLPIRNFLSRYHNTNRTKHEEKPAINLSICASSYDSSVQNNASEKHPVSMNSKNDCKISVKALAKQFISQNGTATTEGASKVSCGKQLRPNNSFLWRSTKNAVATTKPAEEEKESDYHNYYVLENYYSDAESTKLVEGSESNVNANPPIKLTAGEARYQNVEKNGKKEVDDAWIDLSDEDEKALSTSSSRSSTLKRKKSKRHSHCKEIFYGNSAQNLRNDLGKGQSDNQATTHEEVGNFVNSSDKEIPTYYADTQDSQYSDHLYETVYESLGNYLISDENNENDVQSLSPDDEQTKDMYSSFTSLESLHSDKGSSEPCNKDSEELENDTTRNSTGKGQKKASKFRKLRRHLSWTKSDIKLELSSKFNKIKIKKNGNNQTEIGVRVQENDATCTSPKKNTFIKCILKQKSCNNMPEKKSPSPKKDGALFYVHLSMTQGKQRPFSDSCVENLSHLKTCEDLVANESRKTSEPIIPTSQLPPGKMRKRASCQVIQRPKTPPPLPPTKAAQKLDKNLSDKKDVTMASSETINKDNTLYSECKAKASSLGSSFKSGTSLKEGEETYSHYKEYDFKSSSSLYSTIDSIPSQTKRNSFASSTSYESYAMPDESGSSGASSTTYSSGFTLQIESDMLPFYAHNLGSHSSHLSLPLIKDYKKDLLKSPFEEEPLYQFYQKDVQQRASMWYSGDGSESEFEDYSVCKVVPKEEDCSERPVLQTQTSAMDLLRGEGGQRSLWCEVPEVKNSGILEKISSQDRKIQEAMFEVITSEASYLKSLNFLLEHFVQCPEFRADSQEKQIVDKRELHLLFSDVPPVRDVSANFLADLEKRWLENIVLSNVCDIIYNHASKYFSVYVKYCSNQLYQDRTLKKLKMGRPQFVEVLKKLESNPICQGLDMHSFLMLPMQRITRLPLLVDAIFHRLDVDSPIYESCKLALVLLNKLVAECNEGARKMERMEEMLVISHQLDFKDCKGLGLLSASRWLVKRGELVQLISDSNSKRAFGRNQRWCKIRLFLFLFTDLFVVTRKKSDDTYYVVDYCPRNMVQVMLLDENSPLLSSRLPTHHQNVFQLIMLSNSEGKTVEMLLSCMLESDRTRWIDAVTPPKSDNPDEKIYEAWDCPQVQCTHAYIAQQPDELTIEETDVVNVFRKMSDGWFEGERIRDGVRGWFPSSHTTEIVSSHVRARNLRQRYRLLQLSQTYLEEQQKAQAGNAHKVKG